VSGGVFSPPDPAATPPFAAADLHRLLQPYGGVLALPRGARARSPDLAGWTDDDPAAGPWDVLIRGPLPGAGGWTHMFADPANTSCSGDALVGGRHYRLQWFGDPSPPRDAGWHANGMGPLYRDGRLYTIKVDRIEAVDAYNGTPLWSLDIPGAARFSPGREGGSACVDADFLYVAATNDCRVLDASTGRPVAAFGGPEPDRALDWGFLAVSGDLLYGTKQPAGATASRQRPLTSMWNSSEVRFALSASLFALDRRTGAVRWRRAVPGHAAINSTVTIANGRLFFVETRDPSLAATADGSVLLRDLTARGLWLVALDAESGAPQWEQPFPFDTRTMLYLSARGGLLLASGAHYTGPLADAPPHERATSALASVFTDKTVKELAALAAETRIRFLFQARDAATGAVRWERAYASGGLLGAQHNFNVSHPVWTTEAIFHAPAEQHLVRIEPATGELKEYPQIRRGKGCATPTASDRAIFYRSLAIASFDIASERQFYLSSVTRPSCWMSILPAGGLVLMPEYSFGCNCAFPLQTSVAMYPAEGPPPADWGVDLNFTEGGRGGNE
jgi:outer membrane protein assembly factor BamB